MIYPIQNALNAFLIILSALPPPFLAFITFCFLAVLVVFLLKLFLGN